MWKKLQTEAVFSPKSQSRAHCDALLAPAGQLVAPSGLLFELLFVTLGWYWGPLGPKLQKDAKMNEKWEPEGKPF